MPRRRKRCQRPTTSEPSPCLPGPAIERKKPGVIVRRSFIFGARPVIAVACAAGVIAIASAVVLVAVASASSILQGCSTSNSPPITPYTAVGVDIATLLNSANLGCGEGTYDVYWYGVVATLEYEGGIPPAGWVENASGGCLPNAIGTTSAGLYNCFANGILANLPSLPDGGALPDGGSAFFHVQIFFYNYATYQPEMDGLTAAVTEYLDAGANAPVPPSLCSKSLPYTWTATCTATEQGNILVNAACPSGIVPGPDAPHPDAGVEDAATDARRDAHPEDAAEEMASDATPSTPEASLDDASGDAPEADGGALPDASAE